MTPQFVRYKFDASLLAAGFLTENEAEIHSGSRFFHTQKRINEKERNFT